jgi:hypothetical protein
MPPKWVTPYLYYIIGITKCILNVYLIINLPVLAQRNKIIAFLIYGVWATHIITSSPTPEFLDPPLNNSAVSAQSPHHCIHVSPWSPDTLNTTWCVPTHRNSWTTFVVGLHTSNLPPPETSTEKAKGIWLCADHFSAQYRTNHLTRLPTALSMRNVGRANFADPMRYLVRTQTRCVSH